MALQNKVTDSKFLVNNSIATISGHPGYPGYPGHVFPGSSGSDPLYEISRSNLDSTLDHVH